MQRLRHIVLILATLLSVSSLAVVPVAAEDSGGTSGSGDTTNTSTETQSDSQMPESIKDKIEQLREQAKEKLAEQRDDHEQKTTEAKQKACEARAANINRRSANYADVAARHLAVFDSIFLKVQDFYKNKGLNVTNYDALVATVTEKQTAAQTAVDALKGLDVSIDCTQQDPAQAVQTLKTAVKDARDALQAYRTAIKDLIVAIKGASTAQDNSSEGSQQ